MGFKIGDVVTSKRGGALMAIRNTGNYPRAGISPWLLCAWFDGEKTVEQIFAPESVELYTGLRRQFEG